MEQELRRTIRLFAPFTVAKAAFIFAPFISPFFAALNFGEWRFLLTMGVSAGIAGMLEIHTGFWADRYGRKKSLLLGSACGMVAFSMYATLSGFGLQAIAAAVLAGVGTSFLMGADGALLYETFVALDEEPLAKAQNARLGGLGGKAEAAASIAGLAIVPIFGYQGVMMAQVLLYGMAFCVAACFTETQRLPPNMSLGKIVRTNLQSPQVASTLLFSAAASNLSALLVWWTPIYYVFATDLQIGKGPWGWLYCVFWAGFLSSIGVFRRALPMFDRHRRAGLWTLVVMAMACYVVLIFGHGVWAFSSILLTYCVRANILPLTDQLINEKVDHEERATVQSMRRAMMWGMSATILPLSGLLGAALHSVPMGIAFTGLVGVGVAGATLLWVDRVGALKVSSKL